MCRCTIVNEDSSVDLCPSVVLDVGVVSTTGRMMSSSPTSCRFNKVKLFCFVQTNASDLAARLFSSRSTTIGISLVPHGNGR